MASTTTVSSLAATRAGTLGAFVRAQPLGALALVAIVAMLAGGVLAPVVAPYDPVAIDFAAILSPPSGEHLFGTDNFGRDIFSRIVYGARTALIIGFTSSLAGCTVGALIGVASAYYGGRIDLVVQRFVDALLAFPIIVLALVVVAMLGRRLVLGVDVNLILAIALPIVPQVTRVIRSAALSIRTAAYIDAASRIRASSWCTCCPTYRHRS